MPRRSSRPVPASAAAPGPAPKRRASTRLSTGFKADGDSKRQKPNTTTAKTPTKTTTKKSKYFEKESPKEPESESEPPSELDGSPSDYKPSASPSAEPEPTPTDDEATKPTKPKSHAKSLTNASARGKKAGAKSTKNDASDQSENDDSLEDKQLWKEGVRTGLGPGKEVFIQKPKARDAGKTPFQDDTLHPNTFAFLEDLAANNERAWLKAHQEDYVASKKDWDSFVESLTEKIIEEDSTIPELPAKDLVFRIHRDVRFSKNPLPYKAHFSAAWSRTGRKGPYAAYYVHCQPGSCFVGAGLWSPEADKLALIREDIDGNSHRLKAVLREERMRKEILGGVADDEDKAVKAFVNQNKENALKVKPKGYDLDNENIQLLRLRSFTIGRPLFDAEMMSPIAQDKIATLIGIMEPYVTYLNSVVMPDPVDLSNGSESDHSD